MPRLTTEPLATRVARTLGMAAGRAHSRLAGPVYDVSFPALAWYSRHGPFPSVKRALVHALVMPAAPTHHPRDFVTTTYFGSRMAGTTRDLIPLAIRLFGVLEENLSYWCESCLAPGDVFVDVGAHVGYFSLLASHLVGPSGGVVAIEASPATFALLQRNLALNPHAANVRALAVVAGEGEGARAVYRGPEHSTGISSIRPRPLTGNRFEAEMAMAPLAALLSTDELARARLIKVDVEGSEFEVIDGLLPALDRLRADCAIVVETSDDWQVQGRLASQDELADRFLAHGFHVYVLPKDLIVDRRRARRPARARLPLAAGYHDLVFSRRDVHTL